MKKNIPLITQKIMTLLELNEHSCAIYDENKKVLEWCNMEVCIYNNIQSRQQKMEELVDKLKKDGHNCIRILETYPMQVRWCGKSVCEKKN